MDEGRADAARALAFEVRAPSREEEILPLAERTLAEARRLGFVGRGEPRLKLALIELITNAMDHGNGFDPAKVVTVSGRKRPGKRLAIAIADEGKGLDPALLDRDLEEVALTAKRGRGLGIVKRILGSRPSLNARGNEIAIEFPRDLFA